MLKKQTSSKNISQNVKKINFTILLIAAVVFLAQPFNVQAGFTLQYELDEDGIYSIPYFRFEHWESWADSGGYLEVVFTPNDEDAEQEFLRIEAEQGKFFFEYNGLWTFFPKMADGSQAGGTMFYQFLISDAEKDEYDGGFDPYQDLDPSNGDEWEGYSPINDTPDYNKTTPDSGGGDSGSGNDVTGGGDSGGGYNDRFDEVNSRLDQIIDSIPPPPNWEEVADTFYNRIAPRLIEDIENMLGSAPAPPSAPPIIETNAPTDQGEGRIIIDYTDRLQQAEPTMETNPSLGDSGFSADDIKNEAPSIPVREDESGGFDLDFGNPVDTLPSLPYDGFPMPGQHAGEYDHQPAQPSNPIPLPSDNGGGQIDIGSPPMPSGGGDSSPIAPPTGEHNEISGSDYKTHPDNPDGV